MSILLRSITLAVLALASSTAVAHDGGLNAEGCHHDGKGHHCHRDGASKPPPVQAFARDEGAPSLLVLAGLVVLALYTIRGAQGRRSRTTAEDGDSPYVL